MRWLKIQRDAALQKSFQRKSVVKQIPEGVEVHSHNDQYWLIGTFESSCSGQWTLLFLSFALGTVDWFMNDLVQKPEQINIENMLVSNE